MDEVLQMTAVFACATVGLSIAGYMVGYALGKILGLVAKRSLIHHMYICA